MLKRSPRTEDSSRIANVLDIETLVYLENCNAASATLPIVLVLFVSLLAVVVHIAQELLD